MKTLLKSKTIFIMGCVFIGLVTFFTILSALFRVWEAVLGFALLDVVLLIWYFSMRCVIPIKYNDEVVKFRKIEYRWDNVKITIVAVPRERVVVYYLVFSDTFTFGAPTRKSLKSGFFVFLTQYNLEIITKYYHDRLPIVDTNGSSTDKLIWNKKLQQIIDDHNNKYFDLVKQSNGID